jgi:hypothetical protein
MSRSCWLQAACGRAFAVRWTASWPPGLLAWLRLPSNVGDEPIFPDTLFRRLLNTGGISIHPVGPYQLLPTGIEKVEVTDLDLSIETSFIWRRSTTSAVVRSMVNAVTAKLHALEQSGAAARPEH